MFKRIIEDVNAVRERDPAARSFWEVFFLYPGVKAIRMHRVAHFYYKHNLKFLARFVSQRAVRKTGIEIHPGATIGRRLVIDHGVGIVIGETTEIGDDVLIYQGVTLGGTGKDVGKRHPTIGNNSRVAAGAVVLSEVPPNSTVVGVPARVVRQDGKRVALDQIHIPDPVKQKMDSLEERITELEALLKEKK